MVQGNSARRKELAAGRRQDRKDEIARKASGARCATPLEVRARLLHYFGTHNKRGALVGFVESPDATQKNVCDQWWRTGSCSKKRCKLSHRHTICHLEHVPERSQMNNRDQGRDGEGEGTGEETGGTEKKSKKKRSSKSKGKKNRGETKDQNNREFLPAMSSVPLEQIKAGGKLSYDKKLRTQRRSKSSLLFIAFENELVFDAFNPSVFVRWSNSVKQTTKLPTVLAPESSSSSTVVALASLAPELIAVIATCLTGEELTECAAVCRLFAGVVVDPLLDASLWGRLLARDFPRDAVSNKARVCSFKKMYLLCQEDLAMLEANVGFGNC